MSKHPPTQKELFYYKDVAEKLVCPNCKKLVKVVIPASSVVYLVHHNGEVCALDSGRGFNRG